MKLLEEGDFTRENKRRSKVMGNVTVIYWLTVTAVFLFYTFGPSGNGHPQYSWIVWAIGWRSVRSPRGSREAVSAVKKLKCSKKHIRRYLYYIRRFCQIFWMYNVGVANPITINITEYIQ